MGGILGLGGKLGGAAIMSDERAKKNIDRIGTVFASNEDGERKKLPIYEWEYKDDPGKRRTSARWRRTSRRSIAARSPRSAASSTSSRTGSWAAF